jgi:hypothetical protein
MTVRVIFAWADEVPTGFEGGEPYAIYHSSNRGTKSLILIDHTIKEYRKGGCND